MTDNTRRLLTPEELDTIGEIMNISMGSAATAVSTMLEKQVTITTPHLEQNEFKNIDSSELEPALVIKIRYLQGMEGTNATMFRRRDMQVILNLLMGNEFSEDDAFEFDEMSMSAACEVMNQMMGASATALSEIIETPINISTPEAVLVENKEEMEHGFFDMQKDEPVVAISFNMMIKDVLNTTFVSFISSTFASELALRLSSSMEEDAAPEVPPEPPKQPEAAASAAPAAEKPAPQWEPAPDFPDLQQAVQQQTAQQTGQVPQAQQQPVPAAPPTGPMQWNFLQQTTPTGAYTGQQGYYPGYPMPVQQPYAYAPTGMTGPAGGYPMPAPNIQNAEFPDFTQQTGRLVSPSGSNMGLLMGVPLEVSVVVGRTKRKIKDIMEFGQGTVIELDKQTGAPAEIMVNGQLLAYGDVIVVGDNFGVRITEIVGTKELMDSLDANP